MINININNNQKMTTNYYQQIICNDLLLKNNYKSIMQLPRLNKIVLNTTSSLFLQDKRYILTALLALELISGQKLKYTLAKKSIATFKLRENQLIGCKLTLRNTNMYNFLEKFILIIAPRMRDFSGIKLNSKKMSNKNTKNFYFSKGLNNIMIFSEVENHFDLFQTFKGFNISFSVSNNNNNIKDTLLLFSAFQLPIDDNKS